MNTRSPAMGPRFLPDIFLLLFILFPFLIPGTSLAADCNSPPIGSGGSWARKYKAWCEECGGVYDPGRQGCIPGPNWGGVPAYDPVAERHNQAMERNREGLAHYNKGEWEKAVARFKEALEKWPENREIRSNLANAENAWNEEKKKEGSRRLKDALKEQEKADGPRRLKDALRAQEKTEGSQRLKDAFREQEKRKGADDLKKSLEKREHIDRQEKRIAGLLKKMKVDQQAIRTLGVYDPRDPGARAKDFEEWAKLAGKAKVEFEKEFLESLLVTLEAAAVKSAEHGAGKAIKLAKSLNPVNVNAQIAWLESKGVTDPYLFDAMRAIAKTPGKPVMAEKLLKRLRIAAKAVEIVVTPDMRAGPHPGEEDAESAFEKMDSLAMVVGFIDVKYKVLAADFRFMTSSVFNNLTRRVSQRQVDSMTLLTEKQLKLLVKYNKRIRDHGKTLQEARAELALLEKSE